MAALLLGRGGPFSAAGKRRLRRNVLWKSIIGRTSLSRESLLIHSALPQTRVWPVQILSLNDLLPAHSREGHQCSSFVECDMGAMCFELGVNDFHAGPCSDDHHVQYCHLAEQEHADVSHVQVQYYHQCLSVSSCSGVQPSVLSSRSSSGVEADSITYSATVGACDDREADNITYNAAVRICDERGGGVEADSITYNSAVRACDDRGGSGNEAVRITYNAAIRACDKRGGGIEADGIMYNAAVRACVGSCSSGAEADSSDLTLNPKP